MAPSDLHLSSHHCLCHVQTDCKRKKDRPSDHYTVDPEQNCGRVAGIDLGLFRRITDVWELFYLIKNG